MPDTATTTRITPDELHGVITAALTASKTSDENAASVARALVLSETDGKKGHGLSRVPSYAGQARTGKVDGFATPRLANPKPGIIAIDAGHGFAYPALDVMQEALPELAGKNGIGLAAIRHSHHHGVAGHHAERLADKGLVALVFGNTPAAIAPWGGKRPLFGTNPVAFAVPVEGNFPLVIDFASSKVARGNLKMAQHRGQKLPVGWALDKKGKPTTDPDEGLEGSMVPMGEAKGSAIALMVEILAGALTGSAFGYEASSFFENEGVPPDTGQAVIAIDAAGITGDMPRRIAELARVIENDGARLPGAGRMALRERARRDGLMVDSDALNEAIALAG